MRVGPYNLRMPIEYVAIDLETTGLNADRDAIIELAAVRFSAAGVTGTFQSLLRPELKVPLRVLPADRAVGVGSGGGAGRF